MGWGRRWIGAVVLAGSLVAGTGVAMAAGRSPAGLPVAWSTTSAATLRQPALAPNGVVTIAGELATIRTVAHGAIVWKKSLAAQYPSFAVLAPTVWNGTVDSVLSNGFTTGTVDFAVTNGATTVNGPGVHMLIGQLVADATTSTRVRGSYGSGVPPVYEMDLAGDTWLVSCCPGGQVGLPALVGERAFVPVNDTMAGFDPDQGCEQETGAPFNLCAPTWQRTLGGSPQTPVASGANRIVTSDASGVVTMLNATTGNVMWATSSFHTPLGPPAYATKVVYVGGTDGVLRALNATSGKVLWTANAGAPIRTAPTVSASRVFVATDNGRLVAFNASGCGKATCTPTAIGNAALPNTQAAGAPLIRNTTAVAAYGTHLIAFTV